MPGLVPFAATWLVGQAQQVYRPYFFADLDSEPAFAALLAAGDCFFVDFADLAGFAVGSPVGEARFALPVAGFPVAGAEYVLTVCCFRYPLYPCFVLYLYDDDCFSQGF